MQKYLYTVFFQPIYIKDTSFHWNSFFILNRLCQNKAKFKLDQSHKCEMELKLQLKQNLCKCENYYVSWN